jgi:HNH endonuclease
MGQVSMKRYRDTALFFDESGNSFGPRGQRTFRLDRDGYQRLNTGGKKIGYKTVYVHKAMAEIYLGQRPDGMTVNHRDGNKANNSVSNLEYISAADNTTHAFRSGMVSTCHPTLGHYSKREAERRLGIPRRLLP